MGSAYCSVNSSSGNWLTADVSWDSDLKVTCTVSSDNPWRLKIRGSSGDSGVVYSVDYETSSHEFSFNADDGGEYIFQVVNDPGYEYANNDFATSGFTVSSDDDSGGESGDDSGGSSGGAYYIYYIQGTGTSLEVQRTWNEATGESYEGEISSGTSIVWKDYFYVLASLLTGYQDLNVAFSNFNITEETTNSDGSITYRGTMDTEDDIIISSSATATSGGESGGNSGTGGDGSGVSKGAYIGVNNIARKIKRGYIGVDNIARRIKMAYIGVGGIARPCWSNVEFEYYGRVNDLSVGREKLAATHVGNYALFGGGRDISGYNSSTVDAYNTSLTGTIPTSLSEVKRCLAATHVGNYALFGGGTSDEYIDMKNTVDAYNISLTKTTCEALGNLGACYLAATHVGNYAIFAGGSSGSSNSDDIDIYDTSLTKISTKLYLYYKRHSLAATHVGNYALFGGGDTYTQDYLTYAHPTDYVEVFDASLTRKTSATLSQARNRLAATHVGNYAIFGGGSTGEHYEVNNVDAFDSSLTRTIPTELSAARWYPAASHVGNYALFGGGDEDADYEDTVDVYDISLTRTTPTKLSDAKRDLAATYIGNYALFGGGLLEDGTRTSTVEAYVVI